MAITKASSNAVAPAAKGDLVVGNATNDSSVLAVGSTDQVLTVDSSTATGLKWATPAAGGMTLISTTTLSGTLVTLSSIPQTYNHLHLIMTSARTSATENINVRFNSDSTASRHFTDIAYGSTSNNAPADTSIGCTPKFTSTATDSLTYIFIPYYANTSTRKFLTSNSIGQDSATATNAGTKITSGFYNQIGATTSLQILERTGGTFAGGTVYLYGVK